MGLSGYFLYLAQKSIPIGTAYVIWTGIGAIGTVLLGILFSMIPRYIQIIVLILDIDRDRRPEISPLIREKNTSIRIASRQYRCELTPV